MASFTELCCRSGGSNLNAGTRTGNSTVPGTAADFTYVGGGWVNATRVFTVASGNPVTDGIAVDDYAAVDTGGAFAAFIARVTARSATTITLSATGIGTNPANGTYTLRIGGAWKGSNAAENFPFDRASLLSLANAAGNPVRINMRNNAQFSITATINASTTSRVTVQGFTTTYGDGGMAVIDGGTTGASYNLWSFTNTGRWVLQDLEFRNNGATGSADGISWNTGGNATLTTLRRVVVHDVRGSGFASSNGAYPNVIEECEAYNCNQSNTATKGGFEISVAHTLIRCTSHDNNIFGFANGGSGTTFIDCIADTNTGDGFRCSGSSISMIGCDTYNNGGDGLEVVDPGGGQIVVFVENCNFIKNGGWGIRYSGSTSGNTIVTQRNCGFGAGTQANTSGTITYATNPIIEETGTITYANDVTPWVDPGNGDFRINLPAAQHAGRSNFLQTAAGYAGTASYRDIGSGQHFSRPTPTARNVLIGSGVSVA